MDELTARIEELEKRVAALEQNQERLTKAADWSGLAEKVSECMRNPGEYFKDFRQNPEASRDTSAED